MGITRERRSGLVLIFAAALVMAQAVAGLGTSPGQATTDSTAADYHVVTFKDEPVVAYEGGVDGHAATKPEPGQGFDAHSPKSESYAGHLRGVHGDYVRWLEQRAPEVEVVRDLVYAANAIAVKLNGADPALLSQGPGVKYATPSDLYRPTMNTSVQLISVPWLDADGEPTADRADAGAGVKVAVIDSGIDSSHPFIGSCRDGGNEVSHRVFVSGDTTGAAETVLYGTPNDEDLVFDHGTHVAGTIGGCVLSDGLAGIQLLPGSLTAMSGVAPGVELHDYNVFPGYGAGYIAYGGSAFSHDIGAAIEQALLDGMQVVNMSLGGGVQGPHDWLAEVVNDASNAMLFSISAGNSGSGGEGDEETIGSPGTAAGALTVGASTNARSIAFPIVVDGAPYPAAVGDFHPLDIPETDPEDMVEWPEADTTACTQTDGTLTGFVVLVDRGGCTFSTKVDNAAAAGAIGVVVANNIPGDGPIAMAASGPVPGTPAVGISYEAGQAIRTEAEPWAVTADPTDLREWEQDANQVAAFSSRGPTAFTHLIKPDVVAPGVNIRSSVFDGEYAQFQGTSMAAPHVAGAAALVIESLGSWSPRQVKGLLVAAATRVDGLDLLSALTRGNGLVDVAGAVGRTTWADPVSVSFGEHTGGSPVSAAVELTLTDGCDVTTVTDVPGELTIAYDGANVTLDAARTASGNYEGDLVVDCVGGEPFTVPWWVEIDRRSAG